MATATFGRRNVAHRAPPIPSAADARPRRQALDGPPTQIEQTADLSPRATQPVNPVKAALGALFMIAGGALLIFLFASDLQRDISLQDTFRPDLSISVERAKCSRYVFLVSHCNVRFSWQEGATQQTADGSFLVSLQSMGGARVIPVRSTADPSVVTSAVALAHLSNRVWTLVLFSGASFLIGLLVLMKLRRRG